METYKMNNDVLDYHFEIINDGNGSTLVQSKNNMNLTALSVGFDERVGRRRDCCDKNRACTKSKW